MATINAAECFGLEEKGAIAPGYKADFILFDDLKKIKISQVFKDGVPIVENGVLMTDIANNHQKEAGFLTTTVHFDDVSAAQFQIPLKNKRANIIEIIPNSLITSHIVQQVETCPNGFFQPSIKTDQLKLAVMERHHLTGNIGLGIVKGLGLKSGAIATTIAHDSHNLIVSGTNDEDILTAVNAMKEMQGGLVIVQAGEILASLKLSIAGLMSEQSYQEVFSSLKEINQALEKLGASKEFNPFLTLSFLSLPVIPELKLTDKGLFQISTFTHISIEAD